MSTAHPRLVTTALLATAAAALTTFAHAQPPQRSLAYVSEPGDPIGQGRSGTALPRFLYAKPDGVFVAAWDGEVNYELVLVPPAGQRLQRGSYEDARGGTETTAGHPVLEFRSNEVCEGSRGRFQIDDIAYDDAGKVTRLRANFEQRCVGASGSLWGDLALDAGLTAYSASLEPVGLYDPNHAIAYLTVQCAGAPTYGELRLRASQRVRGGGTVTAVSDRTFGCGPEPQRVRLDLIADGTATWRPGPVQVEVESFVHDPHYEEAGRVLRATVQGTVALPHARRQPSHARPTPRVSAAGR
ncbi:hypothetical protein [Cognatilysobacter bugurensis]|uniref:Secreted protein n=1 Tax=Cognatilysobacter bugurensis TaxID=543356 RepID=A0A918SVE7_9GAMM|nr:hypothetical protein [Lysobacter bugurensis]GHA72371.1 hypothetical protein GCM10007067_06070 [Lysobacter bugurensis]